MYDIIARHGLGRPDLYFPTDRLEIIDGSRCHWLARDCAQRSSVQEAKRLSND